MSYCFHRRKRKERVMKASLFFFIAVLAACTILCAGCIVVQLPKSSTPSESEQPTSPPQTSAPQPSKSSVQPQPDATMLPVGIDVKASFLIDLNGDGIKETVSVGLGKESESFGNEVVVSVSDNGAFNQITADNGYFKSASLTETPGGALCLVVSTGYEDDYASTVLCRFAGLKPVAAGSVGGIATDVSYGNVTVSDYVDAIGTWAYTRLYNITDGFAFEPATDMMIDMTDRDPLVTKIEIPVEMLVGGEYTPGKLKPGTEVYPVATDGSTFLFFNLGDGTEGRINFYLADYECYIDGLNVFQCFVDVPYAG